MAGGRAAGGRTARVSPPSSAAMAGKPGRTTYENIQYKPPTPQVFGSAAPEVDLPSAAPKTQNFNVDRPRNRPKLADRLAVYEDDNPRCQQVLCVLGMIFPPFWLIGACLYFRTPSTKIVSREVGFKNLMLTIASLLFLVAYLSYHWFAAEFPNALKGGKKIHTAHNVTKKPR